MEQSRTVSAIEAFLNIGSGFLLSIVVWQIVAFGFGIPMPITTNLQITSIFTVVSLLRSYFWRRLFATRLNDSLRKWLGDHEAQRKALDD